MPVLAQAAHLLTIGVGEEHAGEIPSFTGGAILAQAEIAFHKAQELQEINWTEPETFTFDDYLADFRADFTISEVTPHTPIA